MIAEFGHYALVLALALALVAASVPMVGARKNDSVLMAVAGPAALAQFCFVALAFAALTICYVRSDFSVLNVFENSHSAKPLVYKLSGLWGNHEGSMLLWVLILTLFGALVALFGGNLPARLKATVLAVQSSIAVAFILFILVTSNPFLRIAEPPFEGRDLNPILQDPGLAIHPPLLYLGYVGLSISFSFAIAALIEGRIDAAWARWVRPWTLMAWIFLTLGIAMGSYWAYYELGWGGWWFWDPVENASLMPWLAGTALLHSAVVMEKREALKVWTILLAILAFSLSLMGTFLVRSGVLTSVHAFAIDPRRGIFILGLFTLFIGGALALYAWRTSRIGLGGEFAPVSRESLLLSNNVLLTAAAGAVFLGTLYPLAIDALGVGKISVGPPYFETVFVPLMAPALFLMGVGPLARWKHASLPELAVLLRWALAVSIAVGLLLPLAFGQWHALTGFALALAIWIAITGLMSLRKRPRGSRAYLGMVLAHLGVAVFVVGVTLVKSYESDRDANLKPGDAIELAGYAFRLDEVTNVRGPNYIAARAKITVMRNEQPLTVLYPEKRLYVVQNMPMTEAAIQPGLTRDLYVSLGDPLEGGGWFVAARVKPFVDWIWGGCLIMALGGLLAASDRRYRVQLPAARASAAVEARA